MRFSVLGPLEVWRGSVVQPVHGPRERVVLASLLSRSGEVVGHAQLIETIWTQPPVAARRQLQNSVSMLRRQLGDGHSGTKLITRAPDGYRIDLGDHQLDAHTFAELADLAWDRHANRRTAEAVDQLRAALGLWRGSALAGYRGPLVEPWAARLEEARFTALESCFGWELELGRHRQVIGELAELVRKYPLRERLTGHLMVALYRSGRQADALGAFRFLASNLAEQGLDPDPRLRQLEVAILRNDPALDLVRLPDARPAPRPAGIRREQPGVADRVLALTLAAPSPSGSTPAAVLSTFDSLFLLMRQLGQTNSPTVVLPTLKAHIQTLRTTSGALDSEERDAALRLAGRYAEYAGWMAQEAGDDAGCARLTRMAVELARSGGDDRLGLMALIRGADLALYDDDPVRVLSLATQAHTDPRAPTSIRCLAAQRLAQGYALIGDHDSFRRVLDLLHELSAADPDPTPPFGTQHLPNPSAIIEGWALTELGRPAEAAAILDREVPRIPANASRARARYGTRRLIAHAAAGDIERACALADGVLADARQVDSTTIRKELRRLRLMLSRLHRQSSVSSVYPLLTEAINPVRTSTGQRLSSTQDDTPAVEAG